MRTHSLADLSGALRWLAKPLESAALKMPYLWMFFALADAAWHIHKVRRKVAKLDRLFWHKVRMARFGPDVHFAVSREIDEPYRTARCIILHLEPFRTGIAIGWYGKAVIDVFDDNAIAEHVRRAVTVRKPTQKELDEFDDERKIHGPGRPVGLRFGATGGVSVRGERPRPGMVVIGDDGA